MTKKSKGNGGGQKQKVLLTEPLCEDNIVLLHCPRNLPNRQFSYWVYYYQGNFYHPITLPGCDVGLVNGTINKWLKVPENRVRLERDRANVAYRTPMELADIKPPE